MIDKNNGISGDIGNVLRGVCMGAADIVPGVSGGTIALIMGHYERLVTAISHFDGQLLRLVLQKRFQEASAYCDLRFLIGLAIGIATGIVALASLMHFLLDHQLAYTYAAFNGLILVSSLLVARRVRCWDWLQFLLVVVGAVCAWQICRLDAMQGQLTPLTAYLAASVAICAMILPGISGAFVLLILGLYYPVTELIKGLPKGEVTIDGLIILSAFGLGCATGLLAFSRLLKWLLAHRHDATMAFLVGLMLGSLYKIWPFQVASDQTAHLPFKERTYEYALPTTTPDSLLLVIAIAILAALGTLSLEKLSTRFHASRNSETDSPAMKQAPDQA